MEYIINPSWFYWLHVITGIRTFLTVLCVVFCLSCVGLCITAIYMWDDWDYDDDAEAIKAKAKRWIIASAIAAIISGLMLVFIPNKQTIIEMMIAKKATYDNVSWTIEQVKEAVDYVISAIKEIK